MDGDQYDKSRLKIPKGLFFDSLDCQNTVLANIPPDVYPLLNSYYYCRRARSNLKFKGPGSQFTLKHQFGKSGSSPGDFSEVCAVAMDDAGILYLADYWNHRIAVFKKDGTFLRVYGSKGSGKDEFVTPADLTLDIFGHLVIADRGNARVKIIDRSNGNLILIFGEKGTGPGKFPKAIAGIAIDNEGDIVTSDDAHNIQYFTPDGQFIRGFGPAFNGLTIADIHFPTGIAVADNGTLVVVEHGNDRVQIFDKFGESLNTFGEQGTSGESKFYRPWGLALDGKGHIIVCDNLNQRVQIFSPHGEFLVNMNTWVSGTRLGESGELEDFKKRVPVKGALVDTDGSLIICTASANEVQIWECQDA